MKNIFLIDHPFVVDSLSHLRDRTISLPQFRRYSDALCGLLFAEATRDLFEFKTLEIETPLKEKTVVKKLKEEVILILVLRSGLTLLHQALEYLPKTKIGFAGLERDESTQKPKKYFWRTPCIRKDSLVLIADPMLATGGSIAYVLKKINAFAPKKIRVVSVLSSKEGVEKINTEFPQVEIYTACVDPDLSAAKFISPGLGDYGDRYFGTSV